jgi:hypothetical protein
VIASCTSDPIACSLAAGAHKDRITWIESLAKRGLRGHARDDLTLYLAYAPEAASEVQELIEQERKCCPFLTFDLLQAAETFYVTITAPETARDSANMLFEHFLADRGSTREPLRVLAQAQPR